MFINRKQELSVLETRYHSGVAEFIVTYGRRRVGKTVLLKRFAQDKEHIYFLADLRPEGEQLQYFTQRLYQVTQEPMLALERFSSWDTALTYLGQVCQNRRLIIIIDEYPYLCAVNPAFPSILQRLWDEQLKGTQIFLIICGSSISMMEREVLGHTSPLYGRRTSQLLVEPMSFFEGRKFFPHRSLDCQIETYAISDGIPAYLEQFAIDCDFWEAVRQVVLRKDGFLYDEVRFMLMEELRAPRNYFAILAAMASGCTRLNEIAQRCDLPNATVGRYLDILRDLRVIHRQVPLTESRPHKTKKGIYQIRDDFFRFWFRFIYPNRGYLEAEEIDFVLENRIKPYFADFVAPAFESVSLQFLKRLNRSDKLPFKAARFGAWWTRNEEIDLVALNDNGTHVLVGECKWTRQRVGTNILKALKSKASTFMAQTDVQYIDYALFARSGFTDALQRTAQTEGVLLYPLGIMRKKVNQ